jgi:hypothetical protein
MKHLFIQVPATAVNLSKGHVSSNRCYQVISKLESVLKGRSSLLSGTRSDSSFDITLVTTIG